MCGALIGEPLQVVAPVLHVAEARSDGVRRDDDRALAGCRHRDGAGNRRRVARSVLRGLDDGVVRPARVRSAEWSTGHPSRRCRTRRDAPTSGARGRASRGRPARPSRSSSRAASRCRHPSPPRCCATVCAEVAVAGGVPCHHADAARRLRRKRVAAQAARDHRDAAGHDGDQGDERDRQRETADRARDREQEREDQRGRRRPATTRPRNEMIWAIG